MVKPLHVEEPVDNEREESLVIRDARCVGFLACPLKRDYQITCHFARKTIEVRERDYVGRSVLVEVLPVQFLYLRVAGEEKAEVLIPEARIA